MPSEVEGRHNSNFDASISRLEKGQAFRELSTVIIVPTRGGLSLTPRWVQCKDNLMRPMNQKVVGPIYVSGLEVGAAYNYGVELIQSQFPTFNYMLTWEDDVLPPPDGLIRLYEAIDEYDCIGALYWTKGEEGQPMIYGDVNDPSLNFRPQIPRQDQIQRAYGLGMGFNLFKMEMFKNVEKPWFKTEASWDPATGSRCYTQDLFFYEKAGKQGFKFACDNRIKCGHYDWQTDMVW